MKNPASSEGTRVRRRMLTPYLIMVIVAAAIALLSTYFLGRADLEIAAKTRGFSGIIAGFLVFCVILNLWQSRRWSQAKATGHKAEDDEVQNKLHVLEEANEFFAGSLKAADTFRLIASRIRDLIPCRTIILYTLDESRTHLMPSAADGPNAEIYMDRSLGHVVDVIDRCRSNGQIVSDNSTAALPLRHDLEVYGVLLMELGDGAGGDHSLLEAVSTRVAPLILSSISFERSISNALTDATTEMPNERAFYMILENQVAEAQRRGNVRPLTILAIDIQNFDEINQKFGHAAGDRALSFAANVIQENLRQMDFFARAADDEFLAIMPTATKEISREIIDRVKAAFFDRKLEISESGPVEIELNIGWAAFGEDGETPERLLTTARVRKEQSKSGVPASVLWFPQEQAN